jgi:hypothetical protein
MAQLEESTKAAISRIGIGRYRGPESDLTNRIASVIQITRAA